MKIMKSPSSKIAISEIKGYRADANFTVSLSRVSLAGETAWAISQSSEILHEIRYFSSLADALNVLTSVIRDHDEQKQLLRAL